MVSSYNFEWREKKPQKQIVPPNIASKQTLFPPAIPLVPSSDTITVVSLFQSTFKAASPCNATKFRSLSRAVKLTGPEIESLIELK